MSSHHMPGYERDYMFRLQLAILNSIPDIFPNTLNVAHLKYPIQIITCLWMIYGVYAFVKIL